MRSAKAGAGELGAELGVPAAGDAGALGGDSAWLNAGWPLEGKEPSEGPALPLSGSCSRLRRSSTAALRPRRSRHS